MYMYICLYVLYVYYSIAVGYNVTIVNLCFVRILKQLIDKLDLFISMIDYI